MLETIISISVLTAAIIGPTALSSRSIRYVDVARNNLIASNLAQEGLELVRNIHLNNRISGQSWLQRLTGPCNSANGCFIDPIDLSIQGCGSKCRFLDFDKSLHLYNYNNGSKTIFRRILTFNSINSDEVVVISSVRWSDRFGNHNFALETSMLNW